MSSLSKRLEDVRKSVESAESKILVFDIERMKGTASIEFWDLGDYKNRRIHADTVVEWPRTICVAWNFLGTKRMEFASEWGDGKEDMFKRIWQAMNDADIVVGHNVRGFDIKKLNTEFRDIGLAPPRPYKVVDTLTEARKHFGDESKTLDALNTRIGIAGKTDRYDVEVARKALEGDRVAQLTLQAYNEGDIAATTDLYLTMLPWMSTHPHLGSFGETNVCNKCGSDDLRLDKNTFKANLYEYTLFQCNVCSGWVRAGYVCRSANTRGVK